MQIPCLFDLIIEHNRIFNNGRNIIQYYKMKADNDIIPIDIVIRVNRHFTHEVMTSRCRQCGTFNSPWNRCSGCKIYMCNKCISLHKNTI